jgi:hypothetical protein
MYQIIGNNKVIRTKDIIGVFDLDTATVSAVTRKFLADLERNSTITATASAKTIPRKFVLTDNGVCLCSRIHGVRTGDIKLNPKE